MPQRRQRRRRRRLTITAAMTGPGHGQKTSRTLSKPRCAPYHFHHFQPTGRSPVTLIHPTGCIAAHSDLKDLRAHNNSKQSSQAGVRKEKGERVVRAKHTRRKAVKTHGASPKHGRHRSVPSSPINSLQKGIVTSSSTSSLPSQRDGGPQGAR